MMQFSYVPGLGWLVGFAVAAAALVYFSYRRAKGGGTGRLRGALTALRCLIIALVAICILGPEWIDAVKHQPGSRVAVLLDGSRSMNTKDVASGRLAAAQAWLKDKFQAGIPDHVKVEYYAFDRALVPMSDLTAAKARGDGTALGDALEGLLALPREEALASVIVCSDGIDNGQRDPRAVAKSFRRRGIPINTIMFGTTNDMQDVVVENVQVKRAVPNQAPAKATISLRAQGYQNAPVSIQIVRGNQLVARREIRLKNGEQQIEMDFVPRQKGFQTYEVRVPAQAGEWLVTNNRRAFGLDVIDPTVRVIYMEGTPQQPTSPLPEWKYLKDALESDSHIKVRTLYRQFGANGQRLNTVDSDPQTGERIYPVEHRTRGFPRTLDELLNYDVVIHSDIRTDSFDREQLHNIARLVEEHGGGFVMIGGNSAFGKGGYHRTILDRIIPVAMERENDSWARPVRLQVSSAALAHPLMALGATRAESEAIWTKKFPVLYGCNLVDRAKPGAVVLGTDPNSRNDYGPRLLLAVQSIGKGRSMAFTSDTTRSWGKDFETSWGEPLNAAMPVSEGNCDSRYYRQFWVNAVRWLAAGRLGRTNNPVTLELAQGYCRLDEPVAATVKIKDPKFRESPETEVALQLSIDGKTNLTVKPVFDRVAQVYRAEIRPPVAGDFVVTAVYRQKGTLIGDDRQLLVCDAADRELADLRAKPDLMAALSAESGGKTLTDKSVVASLFGAAPPITFEHKRKPMWDRSWLLAIILGLLAVEWATRRLNGLA